MKRISLNIFVCFAALLLWSCGSDSNSNVDANTTFPKELTAPEGVQLEYLMFENDFNAVPKDGNPIEYTKDYRYSDAAGMSFALSNQRKFGPGVNAIIRTAPENQWYKVSFACFKPSALVKNPADVKGFLVISFNRGDSTLHYQSFPIKELLDAQNKQFIDKWEVLTVWYDIPDNVQAGDRLKIYHWNPKGGNIYFDDFKVQVWSTGNSTPKGIALSHGILEQNYETPDLVAQTTKETASRGVASCILGAGKTQFGSGYTGTLADANIAPGDYVKVSFAAMKKHKVRLVQNCGNMVVSLQRDQQQLFWNGMAIDPRVVKGEDQAFGEWVNLVMWQKIPTNAQPTDILKVYPWNAQPNPIFVDDVSVEVWKAAAVN